MFYVTGEGQTMPSGVTGAVISVNTSGVPLTPQPVLAPTVTVGGLPANIAFYGETPGVISGLLQINAVIPTGLPTGDLPLMVSMGGANSQGLVTVSVK